MSCAASGVAASASSRESYPASVSFAAAFSSCGRVSGGAPGMRMNSVQASSKPPTVAASARRNGRSANPSIGARNSGGQPPEAPRANSAA